LGKILYFDQKGLDHFIIVQPQSLVNILRSFITAECFWPDKQIIPPVSFKGQIFIAAPINLKDKAAGMNDFKNV
jgi:hypothetical protein